MILKRLLFSPICIEVPESSLAINANDKAAAPVEAYFLDGLIRGQLTVNRQTGYYKMHVLKAFDHTVCQMDVC